MKGNKIPKVEQLPSGSYRIRTMVDGKAESFIASSKQEVITQYLLFQQGVKQKKQKASSITLGEAIDAYTEARRVSRSPSTIRGYVNIRNHHFQELMDKDIRKISNEEWQDAADRETLNGNSPKTVKNAYALCCAVLSENKVDLPDATLPSVGGSRDDSEGNIRFLDDKEIKVLCKAVKGSRYELPILLGLNGLRCSEILAMSWDKIDVENQYITVRGAVVPDETHKLVEKKQNKNRTSTRTVPIFFPRIIEIVKEADKTQPCCVFYPQNMYEYINRVCKKNNLTEVGVHGLRHSCASLLMIIGIPEKQICDWLGWSTPDTPRKIYYHLSRRQKNELAEKVFKWAEE